MGLLLVGGLVFLIAIIIAKVNDRDSSRANAPSTSEISSPTPALCAGSTLKLPAADKVISAQGYGRYIYLLVTHPDETQSVLTVDMCTGEKLSHLSIVPLQ